MDCPHGSGESLKDSGKREAEGSHHASLTPWNGNLAAVAAPRKGLTDSLIQPRRSLKKAGKTLKDSPKRELSGSHSAPERAHWLPETGTERPSQRPEKPSLTCIIHMTQIHSIPMSPVWCSTSFEDIEHSIPMPPVWCSTSFEDIAHTGSIIQIHSLPMSQFSCSTSFEDIEYTVSISPTHSLSMSPVWCSTSFEDIEHTGSIIQIHSSPISQVSCSTSLDDIECTIPVSPVWCSTSFEDIDTQGPHPNCFNSYVSSLVFYLFWRHWTHRVHHPNSFTSHVLGFVFYLFCRHWRHRVHHQIHSIPMSQVSCSTSLNTQFLCLQFGVRPLLKTLNIQGPSSKFTHFLCLNVRVLPLLKTLNTQGPSPKFIPFLCLKLHIEHTGSIIHIAAIPMSQVWCSTSFEDIE